MDLWDHILDRASGSKLPGTMTRRARPELAAPDSLQGPGKASLAIEMIEKAERKPSALSS